LPLPVTKYIYISIHTPRMCTYRYIYISTGTTNGITIPVPPSTASSAEGRVSERLDMLLSLEDKMTPISAACSGLQGHAMPCHAAMICCRARYAALLRRRIQTERAAAATVRRASLSINYPERGRMHSALAGVGGSGRRGTTVALLQLVERRTNKTHQTGPLLTQSVIGAGR
jgi:hypothetical protein